MMAKNLGAAEAFWKILYRFFLDAVSAIKSLFAGEGTYFVAVVRAHFAFLYWLFFMKKKKIAQRGKGRLNGYLRKSVVWAYFVMGKKKFTEIVAKEN